MHRTFHVLTRLTVALTLAAGTPAAAQHGGKPYEQQGYTGLLLRDIPGGHAVVSWILPGPMEGRGLECPAFDLARPDLVVSVDGRPMSADQFRDYAHDRAAGDTIRLAYRRSRARGGTIPDELNHEDDVVEIEIPVGSRDVWTGTIKRGRALSATVEMDGPALLNPWDRRNPLGAAVGAEHLSEPLDVLLGVFRQWQDDAPDFHSLSRVRAPFYAPFRLPELTEMITAPAGRAPADPVAVALEMMRDNLDVPAADPVADARPTLRPAPLPAGMEDALRSMAATAQAALGQRWNDEGFARQCIELLRVPRRTFYIDGPDARAHIEVIRASMHVDFAQLVAALAPAATLAGLTAEDVRGSLEKTPPTSLGPRGLEGAVSGDIVGSAMLGGDLGWVIIGGPGDNTYDLSRVRTVIDLGGDDEYRGDGLRTGLRVIIDFAGNDRYTAGDDQGPGGALLGVSYIDDRGGNDRYEGGLLSAGAACYGASLLLDRGGSDVYVGTEWSQGAACYGAGMIVDLGRGADVYRGEFLCQGVGGPRGFGAIVDQGGRDLYRANGPEPSAYGTPAVFQSFSQGVGFGYRSFAAGGVGLISDLGGDDRYEAGEFSQGGAYYFALGILHDAAGRDLYYGNRYGQGFGVHQAHGALVDDAGDDTYWSMTAASQGTGWDIGAGLLLDRAGNDTYQCDGLGQGGASQQAIAMLVDLDGTDRYVAGGGATQGQSGGNAYHYAQTGARSFSLLLDLGGDADVYSRGRANDAVTATGEPNESRPAHAGLHGLVIDR